MALRAVHALRNAVPGVESVIFSTRGMFTAKLPDLPYDYGALQPAISGQIMELHHKKHHQAYINNYNAAMEQYKEAESRNDIAKSIQLQSAIKFNGGGHVNHDIFWKNLCPPKDYEPPSGELKQLIEARWKSLDNFTAAFNAAAAGVQGSGWGWLAYNKATGGLDIVTTQNQDPCSTTGTIPLLGVDVWEHAYYLDYKNVRPDYLKAIWSVVNWRDVASRFEAAKKQ
nr:manganese superoxide dismutase 2 [Dunaliella salina]|eukprot:CAMPEP_0202337490 /NCGR_PEP_ID=MMETSP1126-20121109/149_1 /ASSEMBLY_ACC=CAM_ASM_000457 /TAXON_ID=3047 /ORGANISM="Dunaliella tertiolecta, Strain CCMP1320" /LENGTH=226 /DNA_ID=CAMNT_0048927687 /DNA_START=62 /DNA_END=742 /DNA_ORIENTATION=-